MSREPHILVFLAYPYVVQYLGTVSIILHCNISLSVGLFRLVLIHRGLPHGASNKL